MISNTTLTYDQQVRIAIRKQEAYIKKEISIEAKKKQMEVCHLQQQQHIPDTDHTTLKIKPTVSNDKITNEQRARIERNRMLALEKKKRLLHEQQPIAILPKSQICTANQCTSNQCIPTTNNTPLCGNINTVTPPMKRQKTEQLSNESPLPLEIKPSMSNDQITDEQRARIERNRMMALEKKRLREQQKQQQQHPTMEEAATTNNDKPNKSFADNNIPKSSNSRGHPNNCQQCNQPFSKH